MTQAELARRLGLREKSKGYISRLESGKQPWPLGLALRFEQISNGRVKAAALRPQDAGLLGASSAPAADAATALTQ